jgi:peptide/nickel transport system permease protein
MKQYSWLDDLIMFTSQIGFSTPVFYLGLILILIFGLKLRWFPIGGYGSGGFRNLVLPAITLGTMETAYIAQITRSSLLEVIRQDFVRAGRAKGLGEFRLIRKYILRNALIPIVTIIGSIFAGLLCGAVATEYIFSWPGLGRAIVEAIRVRDLPVVQGGIFFMALVYVLVNLLVDILYAYLDPRIRYR